MNSPSENPQKPPSSSSESSPLQEQQPKKASGSLTELFIETFFIFGQSFVIVYPVFLYFLLSGLLIPDNPTLDFNNWALWVVSIGLAAVMLIFRAGWSMMMYKAVKNWMVLKKKIVENRSLPLTPALSPNGGEGDLNSQFALLKDFIPGMGEYGLPFLIGGGIWFLAASVIVGVLTLGGYYFIGLPRFILMAINRPGATDKETQQHIAETLDKMSQTEFLQSLAPMEITQLAQWYLIFIVIFILLTLLNGLTLFWQQYVIIKQCNPLKAFVYSARQVIKHPFHTIIILFYMGLFTVTFSIMGQAGGFLSFFGEFFLILTIVFSGLFMFYYILSSDVQAQA